MAGLAGGREAAAGGMPDAWKQAGLERSNRHGNSLYYVTSILKTFQTVNSTFCSNRLHRYITPYSAGLHSNILLVQKTSKLSNPK